MKIHERFSCRVWKGNCQRSCSSHTAYVFITYLLHGAESFLRSQLVLQLIKKFPAFYGTRKFIIVLTSARHLSLSCVNSIQSPQPLPTSWRSILILSSHLRLGLYYLYDLVKALYNELFDQKCLGRFGAGRPKQRLLEGVFLEVRYSDCVIVSYSYFWKVYSYRVVITCTPATFCVTWSLELTCNHAWF